MSNLEPGCKAIIIKSRLPENTGLIVTVIGFVGELKPNVGIPFCSSDYWEIDKDLQGSTQYGVLTGKRPFCSGAHLQRIDDHDTDNVFESEKELESTH